MVTDTTHLRALIKAATPGTWNFVTGFISKHEPTAVVCASTDVVDIDVARMQNHGRAKEDAELIAEAVNALPGLLAENERLRAALAWRPLEDAPLNKMVLLQLDDLESPIIFAWKDTDGWYTEECDKIHFPLCWMLIPEPKETRNAKG